MLIGTWKSFDELEENLTLSELEAVLTQWHKQKEDERIFLAGLQGIDLSSSSEEDAKDRFEMTKRRAEAKSKGEDPEEAEMKFFGIRMEKE